MLLELHRCRICGTRWLLWPDAVHGGGWNLLDKYSKPGGCCDNVAMGDQIEHMRDFESVAPAAAQPRVCIDCRHPWHEGSCPVVIGPGETSAAADVMTCSCVHHEYQAVAPAAALSPTPEHFCATCHHRWTGEGAAEHCGYCHRVLVAALQSAALSPTQCCVGCGFTGPLIGFTFEKKPGPFCANCWKALRGMFEWLATDEVSRGASAALSPSEEPKK